MTPLFSNALKVKKEKYFFATQNIEIFLEKNSLRAKDYNKKAVLPNKLNIYKILSLRIR